MKTWTDAERSLRAVGRHQIQRDALEGEMNREIDNIKATYAPKILRIDRKIAAVSTRLELWCQSRRTEMVPASKKDDAGLVWKSVWGKLAFRKCPAAIEFTVKKIEKVVAALKAKKLTNCIRTVEEPNKDVLLALDDATLAAVHCKKKPSEKFEIKPDYKEIARKEAP